MVEEMLSIVELSRRIDQLLDILNMISRDLAEISKSLRGSEEDKECQCEDCEHIENEYEYECEDCKIERALEELIKQHETMTNIYIQ